MKLDINKTFNEKVINNPESGGSQVSTSRNQICVMCQGEFVNSLIFLKINLIYVQCMMSRMTDAQMNFDIQNTDRKSYMIYEM